MAEYKSNPIPPRVQSIIGNNYGRLTVIGYSHAQKRNIGLHSRHHWICRCTCGTVLVVESSNLKGGVSTSCGCYQRERASDAGKSNTRHGMSDSPEYSTWRRILDRCYNPKNDSYNRYGGRGIKVCNRWCTSFDNFYKDMGGRPSNHHSIDRIDNEGDYTPDNCRWATPQEQGNNRGNNRRLTYNGQTMTITQWAHKAGISIETLSSRLDVHKWSLERAITEPVKRRKNNR